MSSPNKGGTGLLSDIMENKTNKAKKQDILIYLNKTKNS